MSGAFHQAGVGQRTCISPSDAHDLSFVDGDVVRLTAGKLVLEAPILVRAGQAARTIATTLGLRPHRRRQRWATTSASTFTPCGTADSPWAIANVTIATTGGHQNLLLTQHFFDAGRRSQGFAAALTLAELAKHAPRLDASPAPIPPTALSAA